MVTGSVNRTAWTAGGPDREWTGEESDGELGATSGVCAAAMSTRERRALLIGHSSKILVSDFAIELEPSTLQKVEGRMEKLRRG